MKARTLMIQGTASSVGKSIITAALCRFFRQEGLKVAPFKSQNMALNAFVTPDGGEIGRAQAVQAEAARVVPCVDMNPILLKPEAEARSQVVVLGKSIGSLTAVDYQAEKPHLEAVVRESLERLRSAHDLVVIEGAGSPAEINLKARDIVNMFVAKIADAPVLLVGDIDRGGVFAAFVGTLALLDPDERARVAGFIVNKFRGDVKLLEPGLDFLRERTGIPVFGVLPYLQRLRVADEDSVALDERRGRRRTSATELEIAVVRLPRISNYDDFQPLEHEPDVVLRFVEHPSDLAQADLVVLPGTKSTLSDLTFLRESGFAERLLSHVAAGKPLLGICGGCQMLGRRLFDPLRVESQHDAAEGLALLGFDTEFAREKRTTQVEVRARTRSFLTDPDGTQLFGYEIHLGRLRRDPESSATFSIQRRNGAMDDDLDGEVSADGNVVGTMVHGLFENPSLRRTMLANLRARRGLQEPSPVAVAAADEYDRLASAVREHLDLRQLFALIGR